MNALLDWPVILLAVVTLLGIAALVTSGGRATRSRGARLVVSARGREAGAPSEPLILFGHLGRPEAGQIAETIASYSTLSCVQIEDLDTLERWLELREPAAILALSRMTAPGEAALAIAAFRRRHPERRAALYQAWDYNVGRAARRALECGADAAMMPGIEGNEMFALLFGVISRVAAGAAPPASVEEHEALLRELAPSSPFWGLQDVAESRFY